MEENYSKGVDWYAAHFANASDGEHRIGEKTPNYSWITDQPIATRFGTHLPHVHQLVHRQLPAASLILVLRDPVTRAISAVNHYMRNGQLNPSHHIDDYLVGDKRDIAEKFGVYSMGAYQRAVKAYLSIYDPTQLLILEFDTDVKGDPVTGLRKACDFLAIDPQFSFPFETQTKNEFFERNIGAARISHHLPGMRRWINRIERHLPKATAKLLLGKPIQKQEPTDAAMETLAQMYREDNERLFSLLGYRIDTWLIE